MRHGSYHRFMGEDTIEMDEDFAGKVANLPACPRTDANGWCRASNGQAMRTAINTGAAPLTKNQKLGLAAAGVIALFVLMRS